MHQYLKAIGFGNVRSKKEMNKVLLQVKNLFTQQDLISQIGRASCRERVCLYV